MIMATCQICTYAGTPSYKSPCSECKGFSKYEYEKPMTNADKIRDMTDNMDLIDIIKCPYTICQRTFTNCCECKLDWLQQPAEVDHAKE